MAEPSIHHDGLPLTPYSGSGTTLDPPAIGETEAELRRLLDQISGGFPKHSTGDLVSEILGFGLPPVCIDHSELFDHWIQKLCSGREDGPSDRWPPPCPDLMRSIKQLIGKLLNERIAGFADGGILWPCMSSGSVKRKCDPMLDMLTALRDLAIDPCGQIAAGAAQEWKEDFFRARQAMFVGMAGIPDVKGFPYRKKQRANQSLWGTSTAYLSLDKPQMEQSGNPGLEILQPTRRSKRTLGLLKIGKSNLPRKRIPIGDFFQADVPQWMEPPVKRDVVNDNEDSDNSRWLGTRIWPIEGDDRESSEKMIGKGRPYSCTCSSPGSVDCIRFHVSTARLHRKSELGQAFFSWGFDKMGEDVSKFWTNEEQMSFDNLIKLNPASQNMSFWEPALEYFPSKSRRDIVNYYFNVYVPRRISRQTRSASRTADSDDDENNANAHDDENNAKALQASYTRYSQSFYYMPASVAYTLPVISQAVTGTCRAPCKVSEEEILRVNR